MEARKAGGNILKITNHIPPSIWGSTCHRITAKIMKTENREELDKLWKINKTVTKDSTWNYAKLYVYRPSSMVGSLVGYDLYLGDSLICRVKNNFRKEIKITKKGMNTLWAKAEGKVEIPIDIEFGKEYYLKCGLGMGILAGRVKLQLVDKQEGRNIFQSIKVKEAK